MKILVPLDKSYLQPFFNTQAFFHTLDALFLNYNLSYVVSFLNELSEIDSFAQHPFTPWIPKLLAALPLSKDEGLPYFVLLSKIVIHNHHSYDYQTIYSMSKQFIKGEWSHPVFLDLLDDLLFKKECPFLEQEEKV